MKKFLISYDLAKPGQRYETLHDAIKALSGFWWHHLESTWVVLYDGTTAQIRDALTPKIDSSDELLVVELTGGWAARGFEQPAYDWLHTNVA
jgi:hypothetical protein